MVFGKKIYRGEKLTCMESFVGAEMFTCTPSVQQDFAELVDVTGWIIRTLTR